MDDFRKEFQNEFGDSYKKEPSFDNAPSNSVIAKQDRKTKPYQIIIGVVSAIVILALIIVGFGFLTGIFTAKSSVKATRRKYSPNEIRIAESNTFKKLNTVSYPENNRPIKTETTDVEKEAYNNFSNLTYHALVDTSKADNMSYSTIGLYSIINELTSSASRDELKIKLNNLLGLNEANRIAFYNKVILANSFATEESTIQLKNSAFFNNEFHYNQEFINTLTKLYCEAYQLSFATDLDKVVEWVNQAVNTKNYIDKSFLDLDNETQLFLFSTLYFKNNWSSKYLKSNNKKDDFYLADGNVVTKEYMKHSYTINSYYDYGTYISFKDYYFSGNASITYLVPKKEEDNIYTLTKDVNIFEDKEENIVKSKDEYGRIIVNLQAPKFKTRTDVNFQPTLEKLGFADIFNGNIDSFKNAFDDEALDGYCVYIQNIKQRNEVEFNEDGTIVKSVTMGSAGAKSAAAASPTMDTLDVKLNQPFIYIIKDVDETPIFVGHVDNPTV